MNNTQAKPTRRDFVKAATIVLPLSGILPLSAFAANEAVAGAAAAPPRTYFDKGTRLTISMWDFSWLLAHHPGGAYEDLERRVAEAAELGYNTLRVDCFPSRILERESTFRKNWTRGVNLPRWGQTAVDHVCNVRKEVAQLANLCRKHGIWLGLDCWDKSHMFRSAQMPFAKTGTAANDINGSALSIAEADEERAFSGYGEIWVRAIKLMREDGVLERAVWIAPMNEVPHFGSRALASVAAVRKGPRNEGETRPERMRQEDAVYQRINHWMATPIRAEVARERIPISYSSLGAERYADRLSDAYDVVDVHFMPGVLTDKEDEAALARAARGITGAMRFAEMEKFDLKAFSQAWDRACRKHYAPMLQRVRDYHRTALDSMVLPSGKRLTAVITESFGPCFWPDHPDVGWQWYKRHNADALRVVAAMDFAGSSLSNYAEPIFALWEDADWHWTSNAYFRATQQEQRPVY